MQELLACFSGKNVLAKHKEVCLSINGTQSVRFQKGTIEFQNYFKQICVERYEGSYPKKYQDHIPCSFAYKFVCVDDKFTKPIVVFRGKMLLTSLLKQFLKSITIIKK